MTKLPITQSQKRISETLAANFAVNSDESSSKTFLFIKSSSDEGVIRNGGRNGARFAPQSFLSFFKRLTWDEGTKNYCFREIEVASEEEERIDFAQAQHLETQRIRKIFQDGISPFCHLGGGHDHIYPLVSALAKNFKKVIIINIDAHADTRVDPTPNSGTPFRQLSNELKDKLHLFQVGLHPFANSQSTLSPLESAEMSILWRNKLGDSRAIKTYFEEIKKIKTPESLVLFSLDADALNGHQVPGVSAVNSDGISLEELKHLWGNYQQLCTDHPPVIGIYELNPVYDNLSGISMRTLTSFLYSCL